MTWLLLVEQMLNGVQFGVFLFLVSAGLTLVLGIMNVVNLAHGSLFMLGAYYATTIFAWTGSFLLALVVMVPLALISGIVIEVLVLRTMYDRDHMDQVLATFGLILFFNETVRLVWGAESQTMPVPGFLDGSVEILPEVPYPVFRLVVILVGLAIGGGLFFLITRTRIGMLIRAGASNRAMVSALGINIRLLYTLVFGLGAILAGIAGMMAGPIQSVEPGMGEDMLILAFVVIVIGGIGSVRGAVIASVLIGIVEVVGRSILPFAMANFMGEDAAQTAGPAVASMLIYVLMAAVLFFKPAGLFPAQAG
jgi:branched-chain amino acid transport system permease protein